MAIIAIGSGSGPTHSGHRKSKVTVGDYMNIKTATLYHSDTGILVGNPAIIATLIPALLQN